MKKGSWAASEVLKLLLGVAVLSVLLWIFWSKISEVKSNLDDNPACYLSMSGLCIKSTDSCDGTKFKGFGCKGETPICCSQSKDVNEEMALIADNYGCHPFPAKPSAPNTWLDSSKCKFDDGKLKGVQVFIADINTPSKPLAKIPSTGDFLVMCATDAGWIPEGGLAVDVSPPNKNCEVQTHDDPNYKLAGTVFECNMGTLDSNTQVSVVCKVEPTKINSAQNSYGKSFLVE